MQRQLGKYQVSEKIGEGAMGQVFRAHDPVLNRDVAIKLMAAATGGNEELRRRFQREAQSAGRLNHPSIITIHDFGEEAGRFYIAMELLDGEDLKERIARRPELRLDDKLEILDQIGDGLAFAHAKDVIHRDLKPANIHLLPGGRVKIMDFGLAKFAASDITGTGTGMIMGTPHYMSPEQVRGEKATMQSDVFSLGVLAYELLANRRPFEGDSLQTILFQVMQNEPAPLALAAPDVPAAVCAVVERALQKDPARRYPDAGAFRRALRDARLAAERAVAAPGPENTVLVPAPPPRAAAAAPVAPRPPVVEAPAWPPPAATQILPAAREADPEAAPRRWPALGLAAGAAVIGVFVILGLSWWLLLGRTQSLQESARTEIAPTAGLPSPPGATPGPSATPRTVPSPSPPASPSGRVASDPQPRESAPIAARSSPRIPAATPRVTPPSRPTATPPPPTTLPRPTPAPTPVIPAPDPGVAVPAIHRTLDQFRSAFEALDVAALQAVHPGVNEQSVRRLFEPVKGFKVSLKVERIKLAGRVASVECSVAYRPVPKPPAGDPKPLRQVFELTWTGQRWLISGIQTVR